MDIHTKFLKWWDNTQWAQNNRNKGLKEVNIAWSSVSRTSKAWDIFYQAASIVNSTPVLVYKICSQALTHLSILNSGTKALLNHLKSTKYKKVSGY